MRCWAIDRIEPIVAGQRSPDAAPECLERQSDAVQCIEYPVAIGLRQRRQAFLHPRDRQFRIVLAQRRNAAAGFGLGSHQHIGRAHGAVDPGRRRMLGQRALLPTGGFG